MFVSNLLPLIGKNLNVLKLENSAGDWVPRMPNLDQSLTDSFLPLVQGILLQGEPLRLRTLELAQCGHFDFQTLSKAFDFHSIRDLSLMISCSPTTFPPGILSPGLWQDLQTLDTTFNHLKTDYIDPEFAHFLRASCDLETLLIPYRRHYGPYFFLSAA
jgi:hypothetical protein